MKEEFLNAKVYTVKKHSLVLDDYGEHLNINEFDFKKPSKFSKEQIRVFELIFSNFNGIFETGLSMITRDIPEISLIITEQKSFSEYISSIKEKSIIITVNSPSFGSDILLQFNNSILFTLIDKVLGGDGQQEIKRELTEIEMSLATEIVNVSINSLKEAWSNIEKMDFVISKIEPSSQYIRTIPPNEMCLAFSFTLEIAKKRGFFSICIPFIAVKPLLDDLNKRSLYGKELNLYPNNGNNLSKCISEIPLEAQVILGEVELKLNEINDLEPGDIIKLNTRTSDTLDFIIGENCLYKVKPGKIAKKLAIKIIEKNKSSF